jgi:SSS family solute:Na+ symporter
MSIQRFLATRDAKAARRTLAVSQVTDVSVSVLLSITGLAILGFYQAHPPQLEANLTIVDVGDQLFPKFIMTEMPDLLAGLVLAAILSAALSSLSSGVNSACAVAEKDFLARRLVSSGTETASVRRLMVLTWIIAAVSVGLSLINTLIEGNIIERCYKVVNLLTAPLFVLFFLALFVRWSNGFGAWCGLISSTVVAIAIAYAKDLGLPLGISFVWMTPCSLLTGILVGTIASAAWPHKSAAT